MNSDTVFRRRATQITMGIFTLVTLLLFVNLFSRPPSAHNLAGEDPQAYLPIVRQVLDDSQQPQVSAPVTPHRFDRSLLTLPVAPAWQPGDPIMEVPEGLAEENASGNTMLSGAERAADPVWQASLPDAPFNVRTPLSPMELTEPDQNFNGIAFTGFNVPDTVGDVGPDHYVQMVNTSFQIFDKEGNSLAGPFFNNSLWAGFGGVCENTNRGDPIVLYDHLADRWLLSQFAFNLDASNNPIGPFRECVAISQGPDPVNDGYYLYSFAVPNAQGTFPDYPKFGVWPDAYYMSSYEFPNLGIYAFERDEMLDGDPAAVVEFQIPVLTPVGGMNIRNTRILPSELDGPAPPAGSPNFFFRSIEALQDNSNMTDRLEVWEFDVNWGAPASSTFTLVDTLTPANFALVPCAPTIRDCIPQPGSPLMLDALSNRPMRRLQYRNFGTHESMVINQTVDADGSGNSGIRWYELRRTPPGAGNWAIFQQGTYAPQAGGVTDATWIHRWMGSIAMDKTGNIALGYSVVNSDNSDPVFPGIRYAGRLSTDALGQLPLGEETIIDGAAAKIGNQRWGDYSAMSVDPVDDCTFWYTQQYIRGDGRWNTRIASFRFPICNPADLTISKSDSPDPVVAGEQLTYEIEVTNLGPDLATNVIVTDTLPAGVTYVADSDSCVEGPTGTLVCSLGDIAALGTESFTIDVTVDSDLVADTNGTAVITNAAEVSGDQLDLDLTNNDVTEDTTVIDEADLQVTKDCQPDYPILEGETAVCTITIENLGPSTARNVTAVDTHTSEGKFDFGDIEPSDCSATAPNPQEYVGQVTCDFGNLAAGDSLVVTVPIIPGERHHDISDTVVVSSDTTDPDPANNQANAVVVVTTLADLSITKTASPDPVRAGRTLRYELTIRNLGPQKALDMVVEDWLPAEVTIDSITIWVRDGSCTAGVPGDPLQPTVCTFDDIDVGEVIRIRINVTVAPDASGTLHNEAAVTSKAREVDSTNNEASTDTTVIP